MQRHLYKHLKSAFEKSLTKAIPGAVLLAKKEQPKVQGTIYGIGKIGARYATVMLQGNSNEDTFTLECGLAKAARFPWQADWEFSEKTGEPIPCFPIRIRLGHIYPPYKDQWWPTTSVVSPPLNCSEKTLMRFLMLESNDHDFPPDRIDASVRTAVRKLTKDALPYLQRCAECD